MIDYIANRLNLNYVIFIKKKKKLYCAISTNTSNLIAIFSTLPNI